MAEELELVVNGQNRVLALGDPSTLASVVASLGLKADRIAVEHNGRIARRNTWEATVVNSHDKLEVVHFVGGGSGTSSEAMLLPSLICPGFCQVEGSV